MPVSRFSSRILAWMLIALGVVSAISPRTVARWLRSDKLKPWRFRTWITPKDLATFLPRACAVLDLYARVGDLPADEIIYSVDEKTSIQARHHASYHASGDGEPAHIEATYSRGGASNLIAGLDVGTGKVLGQMHSSRGFMAFSMFLRALVGSAIEAGKKTINLILDNGSAHRPKYLSTWLQENYPESDHPGLVINVYWLPVRSSWLNQVEIFFSILQAHALTPNDFPNLAAVVDRVLQFIILYNDLFPPFNWTYTSNQLRNQHGAPEVASETCRTAA